MQRLDIVRCRMATGQRIDFTEVESGISGEKKKLRPGEGIYILQNLAAALLLAKARTR